jgi:hypothetical protein
MMFFKNRKKDYEILKIFKIVGIDEAKGFKTKYCLNLILDFFEIFYNNLPDNFDINYGKKEWNSLKNFKKQIIKYNDEYIFNLNGYFSSSSSKFSLSNNILNSKNKDISYIKITIVMDKKFINEEKTLNLIKEIYKFFKFDYAYGLNLNEGYDFDSEKKINKSFFGLFHSVSITKEDLEEENRKVDFKNGYMKKIYPFNIINENQLSYINQNIKINYHLSKFNDQLYILRQDSSIDQVKK